METQILALALPEKFRASAVLVLSTLECAASATNEAFVSESASLEQAEPENKPVGRPISTLRDTGWIPYETKSK